MHFFIALAEALALFACPHYDDILTSACIRRRFEAGPGRRTGRAGPHIQPGVGLRHVQCQRDACHRRPGHMKTNALPSCSPSLSPHPPLLHLPCPSSPTLSPSTPSQRYWEKEGCRGGKGGVGYASFAFPMSFTFSPRRRTHSPYPLFPHLVLLSPTSPPGCFAAGDFLSLLHTRLSVT